MWTYLVLLLTLCSVTSSNDDGAPVLYYYGIEESERGLPTCEARQACGAVAARSWRARALLRLCRCARRRGCDAPAPPQARIDINNRAYFQFCRPVTDWPECTINDAPLTVETPYERMNPDELEELHHKNIQLVPPKITFTCRCRTPNYWKLNSTEDESSDTRIYRCSSLPLCKSGEFCGNVDSDLSALYQSCLCPKHHICVSNGGIPHTYISEVLYRGRGWKAYCQRIADDSYEDY